MITAKITLENFIKKAPACQENTSLEQLIQRFAKGEYDKIAVVNRQNYPVGAIELRSLSPYIFKQLLKDSIRDNATESATKIELAEASIQPFIKPIATLPAAMSLQQFCSNGKKDVNNYNTLAQIEADCALIDSSGEFIGFLDTFNLIKFLLLDNNKSPKITKDNRLQERQSLFSVLEKLPVPLSLETETGVTLYQNLTWREKIAPDKTNLPSDPIAKGQKYLLSDEQSQEIAIEIALGKDKQVYLQEDEVKTSDFLYKQREQINRWDFVKLPLELSDNDKPKQSLANPAYNYSLVKNRAQEDRNSEKQDSLWLILANEKTEQVLDRSLVGSDRNNNQLDRFKNELLANISHELKSPLTAIVGLSTLLLENKIGELNQRQNRYAEQIYRSGRQLIQIVNQLLDLTALDLGQLQLSLESVNIKAVCEEAIALVKEKYRKQLDLEAIEVILKIETNSKTILADELRLEQMLIYLLEMSLILSESGEAVGLKVEDFGSSWISFTVWNTGKVGLAEDFQHLAFEQMLPLKNIANNKEIIENSGLGLILTERLAKAQGGDVSFICTEGKGNEFKILLKGSEEDRNGAIIARDSLVLVIESVASKIEDLTTKLTKLGLRVIIARSGIEAISKAQRFEPQVIFLNPELPLMGDWKLLRLLKLDLKTKNIPVIITSKLADKELSFQNGADGFLSLPISKKALQKILAERDRKTVDRVQNLTILCLHAIPEKAGCLSSLVERQLNGLNHRIIEADCVEQAEILARIWQIDAIVLEGNMLENPRKFLRSLSACDSLAALPLVTMDAKTTEAANQVKGLSVFPCLVPLQEKGYSNLLEVIQIAAKIDR